MNHHLLQKAVNPSVFFANQSSQCCVEPPQSLFHIFDFSAQQALFFLPSLFFSASMFCGFSETFEAKMCFSCVSKQALTLRASAWLAVFKKKKKNRSRPWWWQPSRWLISQLEVCKPNTKPFPSFFFSVRSHLKDHLEG